MLDPLITRIIATAFAVLFLVAALHKLGDRDRFAGILADYQLLPRALVVAVARALPMIELLLGLSWLAMGLFAISLALVPLFTALILTGYTMAIAINLVRGRHYIDCGCGFGSPGSVNASTEFATNTQHLSPGLVVRNSVLIVLALLASVDSSGRMLGMLDYATLFIAVPALALMYAAGNQLLANRSAMGAWRQP